MLLKQSVYARVCVTAAETCMSIPSKATWPHIAAMWSGVRPRTSWVLTVAPWWMRQSAHSSWPYAAFTTQHSCIQCPLRIHIDASLCAPRRTWSWTSDLHGCYFTWNWTIPVVLLATVVVTTATLSSNSCKSASFWRILLPFYGNSLPETACFLGKQTVTTSERSC